MKNRSGQALIEFVVGMIGLMVVLVVLLQIGLIAREHTAMMLDGREEADRRAMQSAVAPHSTDAQFLAGWNEGADNKRYTADDQARRVNDGPILGMVSYALPEELDLYAGGNALSELNRHGDVLHSMALTHSSGSTEIPLHSLLQRLVYDADEIELETDVFMIWTGGLY